MLRKLVWVGAAAFVLGLVVFGWILASAGLFRASEADKIRPDTTFVPDKPR